MRYELNSQSPEKTQLIGKAIGSSLRGGELIVLESDLGGGKTTLTQGIATGLGCPEYVSSPTFSISQIYKGEEYTLHHYDFYRLGPDVGIMQQELEDVISDKENIAIIEWPQATISTLPAERVIHIEISRVKNDEDTRVVTVSCPDDLAYIGNALESKNI